MNACCACRRYSLVLLFGCLATSGYADSSELSESEYRRLHHQLQPNTNELWRTIPWHTNLLSAQALAVKLDKPLFIWAMDGHPLGCT